MKDIYVFVTHLQGISWSRTLQAKAACDTNIKTFEIICLQKKLTFMKIMGPTHSNQNSPGGCEKGRGDRLKSPHRLNFIHSNYSSKMDLCFKNK